ncbi:hypothetical protein ACWCQW_20765 [Streptomyces mirabilis]
MPSPGDTIRKSVTGVNPHGRRGLLHGHHHRAARPRPVRRYVREHDPQQYRELEAQAGPGQQQTGK